MAEKSVVGVRYCGGCNPRYDRVGVIARLAADFPELEFKIAQPGTEYDAVLVVCGCLAQCADHAGLTGRYGKLLLGASNHLKNAEAFLRSVKKESCSSDGLEKIL